MSRLAAAGQKVITTVMQRPWNGQTKARSAA